MQIDKDVLAIINESEYTNFANALATKIKQDDNFSKWGKWGIAYSKSSYIWLLAMDFYGTDIQELMYNSTIIFNDEQIKILTKAYDLIIKYVNSPELINLEDLANASSSEEFKKYVELGDKHPSWYAVDNSDYIGLPEKDVLQKNYLIDFINCVISGTAYTWADKALQDTVSFIDLLMTVKDVKTVDIVKQFRKQNTEVYNSYIEAFNLIRSQWGSNKTNMIEY